MDKITLVVKEHSDVEVQISEWGLKMLLEGIAECYNELVDTFNNSECKGLDKGVLVERLNDLRNTLDSIQTLVKISKGEHYE